MLLKSFSYFILFSFLSFIISYIKLISVLIEDMTEEKACPNAILAMNTVAVIFPELNIIMKTTTIKDIAIITALITSPIFFFYDHLSSNQLFPFVLLLHLLTKN